MKGPVFDHCAATTDPLKNINDVFLIFYCSMSPGRQLFDRPNIWPTQILADASFRRKSYDPPPPRPPAFGQQLF